MNNQKVIFKYIKMASCWFRHKKPVALKSSDEVKGNFIKGKKVYIKLIHD